MCLFVTRRKMEKHWKGKGRKKKRDEKKSCPNLSCAPPGRSHGESYSAVRCRGVPAPHPKGQDHTACPTGPRHKQKARRIPCVLSPRPDAQHWSEKPSKRKAWSHMSSLAPLEQQKTGKNGATPPILRRKDPTYPSTLPKGDMCHPSTIPTHRNAEAYAKPPVATHTLTRVHAQWRLGRVHILNALGAARGCCRAHARH